MEKWLPVKGYPGYMVSDMGRVKSLSRVVTYHRESGDRPCVRAERILRGDSRASGYQKVRLYVQEDGKSFPVHRLVMLAFKPTKDKTLQVNHKDGNKKNNTLGNLEWVTQVENTKHAYKYLRSQMPIGENHPLAIVTEKQVRKIRSLKGRVSVRDLASKYKVGIHAIYQILNGKNWGHVK